MEMASGQRTASVPKYPSLPLAIFCWYLTGTLFLALWGPWNYPTLDPLLVIPFLTIATAAFAVGYRLGLRETISVWRIDCRKQRWIVHTGVIWLSIFAFVPVFNALQIWKVEGGAGGPADLGEAYVRSHQYEKEYTSPLDRVRTTTAPLWVMWLANGMFFFGRLKLRYRVLLLAAVGAIVYEVGLTGTLKNIGDLTLTFVGVQLVRLAQRGVRRRDLVLIGVLLGTVTGVVGIAIVKRFEFVEMKYGRQTVGYAEAAEIRREHLVFRLLGERAGLGAAMAIFYPSHGYAGLSAALREPFVWTYGLGSSMGLRSYAEQYFEVPSVVDQTYPVRAERRSGWPSFSLWCTIFPWLASDLTFPGSVLALGLAGFLTGGTWRAAVSTEHPLAIAVFTQLMIFLAFVPCNNQLFQSRQQTVSTVVLFGVWLLWPRVIGARAADHRRGVEVKATGGVLMEKEG